MVWNRIAAACLRRRRHPAKGTVEVLTFQAGCGRGGNPGIENRREPGLCLRQLHSGAQAAHHLHPIVVFVPVAIVHSWNSLRLQQKIGMQRKIQVRRLGQDPLRRTALELRR